MKIAEHLVRSWPSLARVRWRRYVIVGSIASTVVAAQAMLLRQSGEVWRENNLPKSDSWSWVISISLANTSALLLAAALCFGPVRAIRTRQPAPAHLPLRRAVGVWSGLLACLHVPLAYSIHIPGWRVWWPFVTGRPTVHDPFPIRTDDFAIAFAFGVAAAAAMAVLLVTSNASSIRRFGVRRWKRIQRVAYVLGVLVVLHVMFTQAFEFRSDPQRVLLWVVVAVVVVTRVASIGLVRRQRSPGEATRLDSAARNPKAATSPDGSRSGG